MAQLLGALQQFNRNANGNLAISVPVGAQAIIVSVAGSNGNAPTSMLDELNFADDQTMQFTPLVGEFFTTAGTYRSIDTYIMFSDDVNWPGEGAQALFIAANAGTSYAEGHNVCVYYANAIDLSDPIVGTDSARGQGLSSPWSSSIAANANDLHVIAAFGYQEAPDMSATGQTVISSTIHNEAGLSIAHEVAVSSMESAATGDMVPTAFVLRDVNGVANVPPVADDETYSIQDDVINGTVVGTFTATDSDGTITGYSITGTTLAIDNSGQITIADNTGITAGTPITATVTTTDDDGDTDTALITVNVTAAGAFVVDSVSNVAPAVNGQITVNFSNELGAVSAGDFNIASQSAGQAVIDIPNPTTFILNGHLYPTLPFLTDINIPISDGTNTDYATIQIQPEAGYAYDEITDIHADGYYADVPGLAVGMFVYWRITGGDIVFDPADGRGSAGPAGGTVEVRFYNGEWGAAETITYGSTGSSPTVVPTINNGGVTSFSINEGANYSDPNWSASDDVGSVAVVWSGDTVDTSTPGVYTRIASASNAVGSATPIAYTVSVTSSAAGLPTLTGPDPLVIQVPEEQTIIFPAHAQIQAWLNQWSAVDIEGAPIPVSSDIPSSINASDSPLIVILTATDSESRVRTAQSSISIQQLSATHSSPLVVPGTPDKFEQRGSRFYKTCT